MNITRIFSLFLVFVMLLSIFPTAFATEIDETTPASETEETGVVAEQTTNTTEPLEQSNPGGSAPPTESVLVPALAESGFVSDVIDRGYVALENPGEYALSAFALKKTATLRNCDQMDFPCSDGSRQGFHYADEDGKAPWDYMNMIYCLENKKDFSIGSGHAGVGELVIDGSGNSHGEKVWYGFSHDQRVAIALVILYGAPTKLWDESWGVNEAGDWNKHNPNIGYYFATQTLIWEFATGLRETTFPYKRNSDYWYAKSTGVCMSEDGKTDHFVVAYNSIISDLQMHNTIPSFTGDFAATAPEIQLTGKATTVTDTNGVLSRFDFANTSTVSFSKSGNNLTITTNGAVLTTVQSATATLPDPESSLYEVWYNQFDSSKQVCIQVSLPVSDPVPAFFKLKASTGNLSLVKNTEDDQNKGGWQFNFYSDQACTNKISGPHTTDASGNLTVNGLSAGAIWVKEIGNTDATINSLYECDGTNPQKVTITAGQTATVTFNNRLKPAQMQVCKTNTEDQPLSGVSLLLEWSEDGSSWQPVTYTDSKYVTKGTCTTAGLTDGKLTTDSTGILTFTGLHPEMQYRLTEVATADGYQLLADYAYEGGIPLDTLTVSLKIVNVPVFTLPSTGDNTLTLIPIGIMICAVIGMGALLFLRKKETA